MDRCSLSTRWPTDRAVEDPDGIDRLAIGTAAEEAAARFLQSEGLCILFRNYRCRTGEIDIVCETIDAVLVIAEVRVRATMRFGGGAASVDWRKQQRIQRATWHLLAHYPALARRAIRFDVLDLAPDESAGYRINWIRQAFEARLR
jgi:putative endonuclease